MPITRSSRSSIIRRVVQPHLQIRIADRPMQADHVVLALPFTTLRQCDIARAGFEPRKISRSKNSAWARIQRCTCNFVTGSGTSSGTTDTRMPTTDTNRPGSLTPSSGYRRHPHELLRRRRGREVQGAVVCAGVRTVCQRFSHRSSNPSIRARRRPTTTSRTWTTGRAIRGIMDRTRTGGWASTRRFIGIEPVRQGNVHFCGEHCSINFGGFMNGAVETGNALQRSSRKEVGVHACVTRGDFPIAPYKRSLA